MGSTVLPNNRKQTMKPSHTQTPRTLDECTFTSGGLSSKPSKSEEIKGYALAFAIGIIMALCLVIGLSK